MSIVLPPLHLKHSLGHVETTGLGPGSETLPGVNNLNAPTGYAQIENMIFREDEALRSSYGIGERGSVGTGSIMFLFKGRPGELYAIRSDSKVFYSNNGGANFSEVLWTGSGSAPDFSGSHGFSQALVSKTLHVFKSNEPGTPSYAITGSFMGSKTFGYLYRDNPDLTTGQCIHFDTSENRVMIFEGNKAKYSYADQYQDGWGDGMYFNVGGNDQSVIYAFNYRGGTVFIKEASIWMKNTVDPETIASAQCKITVAQMPVVKRAILADGDLYILNYEGLFRFDDVKLTELSENVYPAWTRTENQDDEWELGYWRERKWVYCSNMTKGIVYIFDPLNNKRWITETAEHYGYALVDPRGELCFLDGSDTVKYVDKESYRDAPAKIRYPFSCLNAPNVSKYLRMIKVDYTGTWSITVYGMMHIGDEPYEIYSYEMSDSYFPPGTNMTGTISNDGEYVMGTDTVFTEELVVGNVIRTEGNEYHIQEIIDDATMVITPIPESDFVDVTFEQRWPQDAELLHVDADREFRYFAVHLESQGFGMLNDVALYMELDIDQQGAGTA